VDCGQWTGCDDRLDDCVAYQGWDGPAEPAVKRYLLAKRRYNRRGLEGADAAVFIADHLRGTVGASLALPDRTTRIYNPVSVSLDPSTGPPAEPTFVTASSLTREKGVETAIRAVGAVDGARLEVFGDGPLSAELRTLAAEVAPNTVFHGRVDPQQVYETMRGATATVFPSLWAEPFGRITVESMALGTPVVGSAVGGIAEVIDGGETGLLYPAGDADALADRLRTLAADPDTCQRLSSAGVEATTAFEPAAIVDGHLALYRDLIDTTG